MTEQEIKTIDCMVQHLQTFFDQSGERRRADFAEPCALCKHGEECKYDWIKTMHPVLHQSNVKFTVQSPVQRRKRDKRHRSR